MDRKHQKQLSAIRRKLRGVETLQCPAYQSPFTVHSAAEDSGGLLAGVHSRPDMDYVQYLVAPNTQDDNPSTWRPDGWCVLPQVELYVSHSLNCSYTSAERMCCQSYDFILSATGQDIQEDLHPSLEKIASVPDGYILHNVSGIRAHIVTRLDGKGYDITQCKSYLSCVA